MVKKKKNYEKYKKYEKDWLCLIALQNLKKWNKWPKVWSLSSNHTEMIKESPVYKYLTFSYGENNDKASHQNLTFIIQNSWITKMFEFTDLPSKKMFLRFFNTKSIPYLRPLTRQKEAIFFLSKDITLSEIKILISSWEPIIWSILGQEVCWT